MIKEMLVAESSSVVDKHHVIRTDAGPVTDYVYDCHHTVFPARDEEGLRHTEGGVYVETIDRLGTEIENPRFTCEFLCFKCNFICGKGIRLCRDYRSAWD